MITELYQYFRWLSLDIVLGAVFILAFLENVYHVQFTLSVYFALSSAIWLIYTCDHLIDAKRVVILSNERHRFHQRNFISLVLTGGLVLIFALLNASILPEPILRAGALLSAFCMSYLLLVFVFKKLWIKEVLVAVVYAVGIFLAPLTTKVNISVTDIMLIAQLTLIAFLNLMIFSYYDAERDARDGFNSLVLRLGMKVSSILIQTFSLVSIVGAFTFFIVYSSNIQMLYLWMTLLLYFLHMIPQVFATNDRYRMIGDGVFFLPAVFLLVYSFS